MRLEIEAVLVPGGWFVVVRKQYLDTAKKGLDFYKLLLLKFVHLQYSRCRESNGKVIGVKGASISKGGATEASESGATIARPL